MVSRKHIVKNLFIVNILILIVLTGWLYYQKKQLKEQAVVQLQKVQNKLQSEIKYPIHINKSAAGKIRTLPGVAQANVLVVLGKAYVAVVLDTNFGQLTYELENQIAHQVHLSNPGISRVNVSADSDFVNLLDEYIKDAEQGKSVNEFNEKFYEIADKFFPRYR